MSHTSITKLRKLRRVGRHGRQPGALRGARERRGRLSGYARDSLGMSVGKARALLRLERAGEIDVQALKALTGLSRKFVVPLLEHFDRLGLTRREGDRRVPGPRAARPPSP